MHISDGVLPMTVTLATYALTIAGVTVSLKKLESDELPKTAVLTSAFFVASLVHVPLGPTSVHLLLPGIVGVLLGPVAFLSITVGLFLQSMLFQFGGLTALGSNAFMMGIPAVLSGLLFRRLRGITLRSNLLAGTLAGGMGTFMAALLLAALLALAGEDFFGVAKLALAAHVPVIAIEALVTGFTVSFLFRVKPDMLIANRSTGESCRIEEERA